MSLIAVTAIAVKDNLPYFLVQKKESISTCFIIKNNSIPNSISLIALGNTTNSQLTNNSATTGAILVPNGNLVINNQAIINGGVFAKSIPSIGNNAKIVFNPKLNQNLPPTQNTTEVLTLESWTEDILF